MTKDLALREQARLKRASAQPSNDNDGQLESSATLAGAHYLARSRLARHSSSVRSA